MKRGLLIPFWRQALWRTAAALALLGWTVCLRAHVGSPTVFFEGQAGPFQARVVIQPPEVIPGLAAVSVRIATPGVDRVTALPIRWNTGRQGAPPPDEATLVRGETNLYSTQLWFMQGGAQSVEVAISGSAGTGKVIVPVSAVATRVLGMPPWLRSVLAGLGILLVALLVTIVGAAVREGVLPPGVAPTHRRRWQAAAATLLAALLVAALLFLGKRWWDNEAADYRHNRLYRPLQTVAALRTADGHPMLRLELVDDKFLRGAPLVPDHGKLMHLFVMREPGLDVFGHVHPQKVDWKTFETPLPNLPLPPGEYSLYGDVTAETGFSDTLTARFRIPAPMATNAPLNPDLLDPDDAWRFAPPLHSTPSARVTQTLTQTNGATCQIDWAAADRSFVANRDTLLRFSVRDSSGQPVRLEPYLGMAGHLVLRRSDGLVFTHLHPGGSFSMAAQQLFEMREDGRAPLKVAGATNDPICRLPTSTEIALRAAAAPADSSALSFPYAFPKPGLYRLWLQIKVGGEIITAVFDTDVLPASR